MKPRMIMMAHDARFAYDDPALLCEVTDLSDEVIATVRRWLAEAANVPSNRAAERLAGVLTDPLGLRFTVSFIDGVIRPEDTRVAALRLAELARDIPSFVPFHLRAALRVGARVGLVVPDLVIPVVRRSLRGMVGHLIVDAREAKLGAAIERIRAKGERLNLNLLGEAVLGQREADRRVQGTLRLLGRADVDYVSIKVSSTVSPHAVWAFDDAVAQIVDSLLPLYRCAAGASPAKFINLDMEDYRDLAVTVAVFTGLLDRPEFLQLEAGIVLQAYLPDALSTMMALQEWSLARRLRGGAPIKVRLVKGANLPMERADAEIKDWPLATWSSKVDTDSNYKRVLDYALQPERIKNVGMGVAGHNLFDVALAWLLAGRRGVSAGVEFEMLLGMAEGQAEVVKREVGSLLVYVPVVHPDEFDVAIAYLIRRLEEGAGEENFMSAVFELNRNEALFKRESDRFVASLARLDRFVPSSNRQQDRRLPADNAPLEGFRNTPDTDPALHTNIIWGQAILTRAATGTIGIASADASTLRTPEQLETVLSTARQGGARWGALSGRERASYLRQSALVLERRRADLLEVMAAETGKTLEQGDPEVSEAIDFANYYATLAEELDHVDGAHHRAVKLTVVTPPWNFPVAIPAGSTLAALAAGSAVVLKPAPQARRCGSVLIDALWQAGVPPDVLHIVHVEESVLGRLLVADPRVDRLILTGGHETAELFRSFRSDLPLLAETSGKNAIVVTPKADIDLAVKDVVESAFGHAGQKCSAASLVILVGSVATSTRFRNQLIDAVLSLTVGPAMDAKSQMGPLIEPATGKLLQALTILDPGESWVVAPRRLDSDGQLWSPGVKQGVAAGSRFHLTEYFGPVLGIMAAESLEEAIDFQNQVDYGLTAGLHSLDTDEVGRWLERVEAGNLYVNRGTTGAIVRRQPFGGWKGSTVGAGAKTGGPNYLIGLSEWEASPARSTAEISTSLVSFLVLAHDAGLPALDFLERSLRSDAAAWAEEFSVANDVSELALERNVIRYQPVPVTVRLSAGATVTELVRVVAAGVLARSPLSVSSYVEVPTLIVDALARQGIKIATESETSWLARTQLLADHRIRLLGGAGSEVRISVSGRIDIAVFSNPVTESGRVEMLPFLREQAISVTAHRFGIPDHRFDNLL